MLFVASGYGNGTSEHDIQLLELCRDGAMARLTGVCQGDCPSFLCLAGDTLYALSELPEHARVTAYHLDAGARTLTRLAALDAPGSALCHIAAAGSAVYGACFGSGDCFALDGGLTRLLWRRAPQADARTQPRAHWCAPDPWGDALYWADLGADEVRVDTLRGGLPGGGETRIPLPAGSGPRQVVPLGPGHIAVVCEHDASVRLLRARDGRWAEEQVLTASACAEPRNYPGGAARLPDGSLLVANRGPNTIALLRRGEHAYEPAGEWEVGGDWPRHIACQGDYVLAACQNSGQIRSFAWDGGRLRPLGAYALPRAACVLPL
ncbi:MAG: lactonase family protein [Clostridiales bacterium]|nr:lactonase family protein [Clostridiales bacterium]